MDAVRLGVDADRWVLRLEQLAERLVEVALADADRLEGARDDHFAGAELHQARRDLRLPHPLQLRGRAGHGDDDAAVLLHPPAGGGAARVGDRAGGGDEHRLLDVALREAEAAGGEEGAQPLLHLFVHVHLLVQAEGDRLAGEVVLGGAEAAGDEDEVGALVGAAYRLRQALEVVADGGNVVHVDAHGRQADGEVLRIGVEDLAEQYLRANGDDLRLHGTSIAADSGQ